MAASSYHAQAVNGVQAVIQGLTLTGLPSANVVQQLLPTDLNVTLPGVIVGLAPLAETLEGTQTGTDDVGYPVSVVLVAAKNQGLAVDDGFLFWRKQIAGALHLQRPAALTGALTVPLLFTRWEPGAVIDEAAWKDANLWVSAMVFRVLVRKTRP